MSGSTISQNETNPTRIIRSIRELFAGRSNAVGQVTLTPGSTTTVVQSINSSIASRPIITPVTANAAAAITTTYVSSVGKGQFTLTHANSAQTDRTFNWAALG